MNKSEALGRILKDASHYFERSEYSRDGIKKIQEDIRQADVRTAFDQTVRSSFVPKLEKRGFKKWKN